MVQVQNIDKICRENLNTYPFEYIVIENFITGLEDKNLFENYIKSQETLSQEEFLHDGPQHVSAYLDIIEKIRQKNKDIVEAINANQTLHIKTTHSNARTQLKANQATTSRQRKSSRV